MRGFVQYFVQLYRKRIAILCNVLFSPLSLHDVAASLRLTSRLGFKRKWKPRMCSRLIFCLRRFVVGSYVVAFSSSSKMREVLLRVFIGNKISTTRRINRGIIQGGILTRVLFILYLSHEEFSLGVPYPR